MLVLLVGMVATSGAWILIRRGRPVWRTMPPILAGLGALALVLGRHIEAPTPGGGNVPGSGGQVLIGLAVGAVLYGATRVFVAIAVRVPVFARQTAAAYGQTSPADRTHELVLTLALAVPGEELFWRGFAYRYTAGSLATTATAAVAVVRLYVLANAPSRSLPIIAGAIVGGAVWGFLAWWSGAVLAPLASHILWTGLMLGAPPGIPDERIDR